MSLHHDGGGDSQGLVNMVRPPKHVHRSRALRSYRYSQIKYTLETYKGDPRRVFVTGSSSGGMVSNVLAAAYPDVFAAGASFSGAPAFACWSGAGAGAGGPDPSCATKKSPTSAQQWGDLARSAAAPGYNGSWPRMQIWHGTADSVVSYGYLANSLDQWSSVHGVVFAKNETSNPQLRYTKMVYGDGSRVVGYSAEGVGHIVPFHEKEVLEFFGLLPAV